MKKILSVILCSVLMFTLVACGNSEVTKESSSKPVVKEAPIAADKVETNVASKAEVKTEDIKSREVMLYFSDDQAMYLVGVKRSIEKPTAKSIVAELVKGPSAQNEGAGKLYATLPADLEILDVVVKENIAYVDFKSNVTEKMKVGSAGDIMAFGSITNTLILDKELGITKVQFLVEGKKVDAILGHVSTIDPMSENKELIKK